MRTFVRTLIAPSILALAVSASAQSPNTSALVVVVVDQAGGVVADAKVSVVNGASGSTRTAKSGAEGSVTIAGLPLTGTYTVSVIKSGFTAEDVAGLTLRAGETATVKVKIVASGGKS